MAAHPERPIRMRESWQLAATGDLLEQIDASTASAVNAWLRERRPCTVAYDGAQLALEWIDAPCFTAVLALEIDCGAHRVLIAVDGLAAFDPLLVGEPFALLPAALRELVVQKALAMLLTNLPRALSHAALVRAFHWQTMVHRGWQHRIGFSLRRLPAGPATMGVLAMASPATFAWLNEQLPVDRDRRLHDLRQIRIPLRLAIGASALTGASLRALEPGDVVWIQSARVDRRGLRIELRVNKRVVGAGYARRNELHLQHFEARATMNTEHSDDRSDVRPAVMQPSETSKLDLDIPVSFDLGELPTPLADLECLQPGSILTLEQDTADARVNLRVAGALIAQGQLVAVGKRIGVRVNRVYLDRQAE
jgi:type III secretion protein Q